MADNPNQGYHSNRWYRRHPEVIRQNSQSSSVRPAIEKDPPSIIKFLRFIGVALIVGGFGVMVMPTLYWYGMPAVQVGCAAVVLELCTDSAFRKKHRIIGGVLVLACLCFWSLFNYRFVFIKGEMKPSAIAMFKGSYPSGTSIGKIGWDYRLTDLRVGISNPTDDEYQHLDVTIRPDFPTYMADKLEAPSNCDLHKIPGGNMNAVATNVKGGDTTVTWSKDLDEVQDNAGDVLTVLLTESGYRLTCDSLPSHSLIKLVFALAVIDPKFKMPQRPALKHGESLIEMDEIAGMNSQFDILAPRPYPRSVSVDAKYVRRFKPFEDSKHIDVAAGN